MSNENQNIEPEADKYQIKWYISLPVIVATYMFCFPISMALTIFRLIRIRRQKKVNKIGTIIAIIMQVLLILMFIFIFTYKEPWKKEYEEYFQDGNYQEAQRVLDNQSQEGWTYPLIESYFELSEKTGDFDTLINCITMYYDSLEDKTEFNYSLLKRIGTLDSVLNQEQILQIECLRTEIDNIKKEKESLSISEETLVANEHENLETTVEILDEIVESNKNVQNGAYKTIFSCEYPSLFKKDRKKVINFMKNIDSGNEKYILLERDGNGFKQTLSSEKFAYFGKIKNGVPDGLGMIVTTDEIVIANTNKKVFIPLYAGDFKDGKYHGYGMKFDNGGIAEEGEYKKGKISGKCILYQPIEFYLYAEMMNTNWKEYWDIKSDNDLVIEYPILQPVVSYEGLAKSGELRDKKGKVYHYAYEQDEETGEYSRNIEGLYGILKYEGGIVDGKYSGEGKEYYPSGKLKYKGGFKKGKWSGDGILYDESGNVIYKGKFKDGDIK